MQKKIWILWRKIQILSCFELTDFFYHFYRITKKIWKKKLVKLMLSNFSNFNCWKNPKFYLHFLHNLAISGPGKCKIWNLGIKISKITKFELWEMMRSKVLFFPMLNLELIETYQVKLSTVLCNMNFTSNQVWSREASKVFLMIIILTLDILRYIGWTLIKVLKIFMFRT